MGEETVKPRPGALKMSDETVKSDQALKMDEEIVTSDQGR